MKMIIMLYKINMKFLDSSNPNPEWGYHLGHDDFKRIRVPKFPQNGENCLRVYKTRYGKDNYLVG